MQFIDLSAGLARIRPEINAAISTVLNHGQYILGPEIYKLEEKLAQYIGVKHCISVASGTTALHIALMSLKLMPGDEVITTPFSFFATVEVIKLLGATPVFVDINPKTYNLDPTLLEQAITSKTKAIMPVSLYGQCADYDLINLIAAKYNIAVIEDGGQSFGAIYKGRRSLGLTTIGCTSFFPSKPLGCFGDAGACFTNNDHLATMMRSLINHGQSERYHHELIGTNGRMDTIQAAILLVKFENLFQDEFKKRAQVAHLYQQYLKGVVQQTPYIEPHNVSVFAQYTIQVDERPSIVACLKEKGIPTAVHYHKPLHQQPGLGEMFNRQSFPIAEAASDRVISLPFHPYLEEKQIAKITEALKSSVLVVRGC